MTKGLDVLLIAGDIATGPTLKGRFEAFLQDTKTLTYFVLGNHDYWSAPAEEVEALKTAFKATCLDTSGVIELTPTLGLVGRSSWYDARGGNPFQSEIVLNDWFKIPRFRPLVRDPMLLIQEFATWADSEVDHARPVLKEAAQKYREVYFVTHFPCFREACWGEDGALTTDESGWFPWSLNTRMGSMVMTVAENHPEVQFTIFTGHTHGEGEVQVAPNLKCIAGKAVYGAPALARTWTLPT